MQLSKFKAVAKQRNAWQAVDLGIVMARDNYAKLFFAMAVPTALLFCVLTGLLWKYPYAVMLTVWWLKPVLERPILYIISRELFSEKISLSAIWRQYWSIVKFDLFPWLTYRRFSPTRSFDLPITLLERLKGKARSKRLELLHRRLASGAGWTFISGAHFEGIFYIAFFAGLATLLPQGVHVDFMDAIEDVSLLSQHASNVVWLVVMLMIAPFYVCAGFSLYLQRRIDLEAWDIEIKFRSLAERRENTSKKADIVFEKKNTPSKTLSAVVLCACFISSAYLSPSPVYAETQASEPQNTDNQQPLSEQEQKKVLLEKKEFKQKLKQSKEDIRTVLTDSDFQNIKVDKGWRIKKPEEKKDGDEDMPEWLKNVFEFLFGRDSSASLPNIAQFFEILLWGAVISCVLIIVIKYRKWLLSLLKIHSVTDDSGSLPQPKVLFGLDVTQKSMQEDALSHSQAEWNAGNQRMALSILLRATVIKLLHDYKYPFIEGYTEQECVRVAEKMGNKKIADFLRLLTQCWLTTAYAHKECSVASYEQLCQQWPEVFAHEK